MPFRLRSVLKKMNRRTIFLLCVISHFEIVVSYNFQASSTKEFKLPTKRGEEQLLGWSTSLWRGNIVLGAPGQNSNNGAVYFCSNHLDNCSEIDSEESLLGGRFGLTLAADDYELYACAPLAFLREYGKAKSVTGVCYRLVTTKFKPFVDFNINKGKGSRLGNSVAGGGRHVWWFPNSLYAFSATVMNGNLLVGAPYLKDNNFIAGSKVLSGAVIRILGKDLDFPDPNKSNYAVTEEEINSGIVFKLAGEKIAKGNFSRSSGLSSSIVSAPKAEQYKGKVYICVSCFTNERPEENLEVSGKQMGERFGADVTDCDMNGDGLADLVVGAPFYSPTSEYYDVGRVDIWWNREGPTSLTEVKSLEPTRIQSGLGFGRSVSCLADVDNDGVDDVAVGAPGLNADDQQGAVYIFYGNRDEKKEFRHQILKAEEFIGNFPFNGFGWSLLTLPSIVVTDSSGVEPGVTGLVISAPPVSRVILMRTKPVVRIQDESSIIEKTPFILLDSGQNQIAFTLKIEILNKMVTTPRLSVNLSAELKVEADPRLMPQRPQKLIVPLRPEKTEDLAFYRIYSRYDTFADAQSAGIARPKPLEIKVSVSWSILASEACKDQGSGTVCPMLDPDLVTEGETYVRELPSVNIPFKRNCVTQGCLCELKIETGNLFADVNGRLSRSQPVTIGPIHIENQGPDEAQELTIRVGDKNQQELVKHLEIFGCYLTKDNQTGVSIGLCPILRSRDNLEVNLRFSLTDAAATITERPLTIPLSIRSGCPNQAPTQLNSTLNLIPNLQYGPTQESQKYVTVNPGAGSKFFIHKYEICNHGWITSTPGQIFVIVTKCKVIPVDYVRIARDEDEGSSIDSAESCRPLKTLTGFESTSMHDMPNVTYLYFNCKMPKLNFEENIQIEIGYSLNIANETAFNDTLDSSCVTSYISGNVSGVKIASFYQTTVSRFHHTLADELLRSWDIMLGSAIGFVLIFFVAMFLWHKNVFSAVRIYKDELDIIAEAKNEANTQGMTVMLRESWPDGMFETSPEARVDRQGDVNEESPEVEANVTERPSLNITSDADENRGNSQSSTNIDLEKFRDSLLNDEKSEKDA